MLSAPKANPSARIGWLENMLRTMALARVHAISMTSQNSLTVAQAFPLHLAYNDYPSLLAACRAAIAGEGRKSVATQVTPAGPADNTLALAFPAFGVRLKISDSLTNIKFGIFDVKLLDTATLLSEVYVDVAALPIRVGMLGIAFTRGQATVVRIAVPTVTVVAATSSTAITVYLSTETLNEADLGGLQSTAV